ncbi:MAG: hypothetical protein ACI9EW_002052 [Cellvibrionaceae bacterium]|jgi:hypothetical protein
MVQREKIEKKVLELEHQVWQALVSGDKAADSALLADNFLGVYPSGFAVKADHTGQLDSGPTIAHYEILEARIMELASLSLSSEGQQVVLLSYLASYARKNGKAVGEPEVMYVTSIWRQSADGGWKNVFSQDTPTES